MAKVKTNELIGAALDWAVAKADDNLHPKGDVRLLDGKVFTIEAGDYERPDRWQRYSPSTDWACGGLILEREQISVDFDADPECGGPCAASTRDSHCYWVGPTPLIAAMRCFCSKLGDEIEIPRDLL